MKNKHRLLFILLPLLVVSLSFFHSPRAHADALNYTNHPLDDSIMRASGTMSAYDIQVFLSQQGSGLASFSDVENCGSTSGSHYSYYATYYSCGGTRSAAQIIYDAGQAYGINPQVLLATMQKEQSLITTPNPAASQLNYAMGYGCPDSGGCGYAGFFNQVDNGAWQLRTDMELGGGNNWWGYTPASYPCNGATRYYSAALKTGNDVTFYDDSGTGYTHFVIPNMATGTLYCYTPHVYPGSAQQYYSGSYWFVYYYNKWFHPYTWRITSQYAYTDQTKATATGLSNLTPGQRVYVGFTVVNTGTETWSNTGANPIDVGTLRSTDRASVFFDDTWLGQNRPARMIESSVAPGGTATFEFWMKAPTSQTTNFNEYFGLLSEGVAWMPDIGMYFGATVQPARYSWQVNSQYAYTDQTKTTPTGLGNLSPGQRVYVGLNVKNTGNISWSNSGAHPVDIGTSSSYDRYSSFANGSNWLGPNRPARMVESSVAPGQTATFEFWMSAPPSLGGSFKEYFNLLSEGQSWMNDIGLNFAGSLINPQYSWKLTSQYAYTDSSKTTPIGLDNLTAGQTSWIGIKVTNTSSVAWFNNGNYPLDLGATHPVGRASPFFTAGWPGYSRPARMVESSVAPGQTATFELPITAPTTPGNYLEYYSPVSEGFTWLPDIGLNFNIIVH
jgi:hypothetical protein